jgi:thiol-disulfide isomerase/thioredoxin
MPLKMLRLFTGFILAAILFLFACQLPGKIIQSIRGSGSSMPPTASPSVSTTKSTSQAGLASATPVMAYTATPGQAIVSVAPAYPGGETPGVAVPTQAVQASPTVSAPSGGAVPSETGVAGSGSGTPATGGALAATTTVQGQLPGAYPGPQVGQATLPVDNDYPGPGSQATISGSDGAYPMPGSQATVTIPATLVLGQGTITTVATTPAASPTASASVTQPSRSPTVTQQPGPGATQPSVTPRQSATATLMLPTQNQTATFTPVFVSTATSSPTLVFISTATPSPTLVFILPTASPSSGGPDSSPTLILSPTATFFVPTWTPSPTRTPFLTPTPTITFTPTPTRTPLPVPPWVSVQLHATNPHTVQLAAGKPQLIEFFAFWSGPSLAMAPIVQGVEKEYSGRVNLVYLDIDDPDTDFFKQQLHYRSEPHFFLLDARGKVLRQWVGYVTVEQFRQSLDAAVP